MLPQFSYYSFIPGIIGSSSLLRSLARVQCPMSCRHSTRDSQVTGCRPSPSTDHLSRMRRQAGSTSGLSLSLTALMTPPWNWRARDSFSQSAQTFSTTLTGLPPTPTKLCSCHISGVSPARRDTGKHSSVSANSVQHCWHQYSVATQFISNNTSLHTMYSSLCADQIVIPTLFQVVTQIT